MTSQESSISKNLKFSGSWINGFSSYNCDLTIETLIDKLADLIIHVKSSRISRYHDKRKYLTRTAEFITTSDWSDNKTNIFSFELSNISAIRDDDCESNIINVGDRIISELVQLYKTAPSTLDYVLRETLRCLFEMLSASWFFKSARKQIHVELMP